MRVERKNTREVVAHLRLYRDYGIDRPLVDIGDDAFAAYGAALPKPNARRRAWWKLW